LIKIEPKNIKKCDNSKIRISSKFILSISLLIIFGTLLLRPSLHCNTPLQLIQINKQATGVKLYAEDVFRSDVHSDRFLTPLNTTMLLIFTKHNFAASETVSDFRNAYE